MSKDDIELHSDSNDSDFEQDEQIAFPVSPSQAFLSRNGELEGSSSPNMHQAKLVCRKQKKDSARAH